MRILIAVHTYYPEQNGVQTVTQYIAEGLVKKNNEVLVISEEKDNLSKKENYNGVDIERIKVSKRGFAFVGEKAKFLNRIQEFNPDVYVAVCMQSWPFDWTRKQLSSLKCKKVLYTHGCSALFKNYPLCKDLMQLKLRAFKYHFYWKKYYGDAYRYMQQYDLVTYLSINNISYWYAQKHELGNGEVLCNAVDDIFFEKTQERKTRNTTDKLKYIYVANYDANKNQKEVLKAFIKAELDNTEMVFVGSKKNAYYDELIKEYNSLQEEIKGNVTFHVGLKREEIPIKLLEADVFVCGSQKEEYPIMLCEAAVMKLPIITTKVGHASEMKGAYLVNNCEEMSDAMRILYNNENERIERGEQLYKYALRNYRISDKVEWMHTRLEELLKEEESK